MSENASFFNLYRHNFVRVAVAIPTLRVADPAFNAGETIALLRQADKAKAMVALFPELGLSAYSCDDLFHQQALQAACIAGLGQILAASRELSPVAVVGLPLQLDGALYNCAAVVHRGRLLGVVPKSYIPTYREFYERRQFAPASCAVRDSISLCGQPDVPFGPRLLFQPSGQPLATFHVEICEDLWVPIPPSSHAALAGAALLLNLSASNVTIGKADYRRELVAGQSARCIAAYAYAAAGFGESTTDLAWDGHGLVCENGTLLAESERFSMQAQLLLADVDLDRLHQDRAQQTTFADTAREHRHALSHRTVEFELDLPNREPLLLQRTYARFPYVPSDPARRRERCEEIMAIQTQGLVKRMQSARIDKLVIGISGGLDSAHALLVCARAVDALGLPRTNILAYTLPGFATGERTLGQARRLMSAIGATAEEIDIRPAAMALLKSIGHPFASGERTYDLTFENVQAGERTNHLFRLAGMHGAMVVGTSDLSELALGWCTYGVGDHMAHYHVNASVPKTLVQHLVRWGSESGEFEPPMSQALLDVLETEISPELVPAGGTVATGSEATVGPYPLQDFHLYYTLRFGYSPAKVAFLAWHAWRDDGFDMAAIRRWLGVFAQRFFQASQYKRSCMANAPKVGSGGSLSPRGDWRAPSDAQADVWLREIEQLPDAGPRATQNA
jgi:NAD+ synthase (glutamine-hydrolysing)